MAKKAIEEGIDEAVADGAIKKIDHNFQREDLNSVVDKLNEVIDAVNNL